MGNIFSMHKAHSNTEEWLSISNGGTSVFISALVLSGSRIAQSDKEKQLVTWFEAHDQTLRGIGTVGFYISEIPWNIEDFERERDFVLKMTDGAIQKSGWEVLDYTPHEENVTGYLRRFRWLIENFDPQYIDRDSYNQWLTSDNTVEFYVPKAGCSEKEKGFGIDSINHFNRLVSDYKDFMTEEEYKDWAPKQVFPVFSIPEGFHTCKIHNVIIYWNGCVVCNDK